MPSTLSEPRKTGNFRETYRKNQPSDRSPLQSLFTCSRKRLTNMALSLFPVWRIMRKYQWKTDFLSDLICGITVGIMQLPQGMAYAMLAEMPPVVGLYLSFFPVIIYYIFGTSKHVSMGTVAVVSLLTGSVVARFYDTAGKSTSTVPGNATEDVNVTVATVASSGLSDEQKIAIGMSVCFLVGLVQITMGICRLGFVTTYMSDPLIAGFTTGVAIHVGTSQVKYVFGLNIPRTDGMFQVVNTYIHIFSNIHKTNIATLIISIICVVALYLVKEQINQRFKKKLRVPVPIELIVVVGATLATHYGNFYKTYGVKIVGDIPRGLPQPSFPTFVSPDKYITDVFIIAIISFAQSVSLAAIMAKKNKYTIDSNQELMAYGIGNIFGSFFSCYPFAASVSRSSVQESAGGKTQVASLFSAGMVLIVILWLGPLFKSLPSCALSAIIIVALKGLIFQLFEIPNVWKTSKYDCFIWVVTFVFTTLLHVDFGLLIGIVFSFFTVVLRTQVAKPTHLAKVSDEKIFKDPKYYIQTIVHSTIKVVGYHCPIYYANGDLFASEVYRLATIKPEALRKHIRRANMTSKASLNSSTHVNGNSALPLSHSESKITVDHAFPIADPKEIPTMEFKYPLSHIILDLSAVAFVDSVGCKVLKNIIQEYASVDVKVWIANISDDIWNIFDVTDVIGKHKESIYLTVDDAYKAAKDEVDNEKNCNVKCDGENGVAIISDMRV
ncbi:prestin-like [Dreissena polymorpha]|uniref:prestin-like n=1 Tax=Dreissena polymorpha TaxID=45954 RepID=UPI00226460AF|nr:prestin-like [Dreissena polymorpha]XP_052269428.1 prestin-like [Dreissena polymorpha]